MFAIPGIVCSSCGLICRPQEFFVQLRTVPLLYLFFGLALFGLAVDLKLRRTQLVASPLLGWVARLRRLVRCSRSRCDPERAADGDDRLRSIPFTFFFLVCARSAELPRARRHRRQPPRDRPVLGIRRRAPGRRAVRLLTLDPDGARCRRRSTTAAPAQTERECCRRRCRARRRLRVRAGRACFGTSSIGARPRALPRRAATIPTSWRWRSASACRSPSPSSSASARRRARCCSWVSAGAGRALHVYTQSRGGQLVFLAVLGAYFVKRYGCARHSSSVRSWRADAAARRALGRARPSVVGRSGSRCWYDGM